MNKERTFTEKEVIEMLAFTHAMNAYRAITDKKELDESDQMLITHLRIFCDVSMDTLNNLRDCMKDGQSRVEELINGTGMYCMIMM